MISAKRKNLTSPSVFAIVPVTAISISGAEAKRPLPGAA